MIAAHPELSSLFSIDGADYLQWRQAKIFIAFKGNASSGKAVTNKVGISRIFAALKHWFSGFAALVLTLWAVIVRGRKNVLVFSVDKVSSEGDHDFRIDGLYRFLRDHRVSFTETFHTQMGKTMLTQAVQRGRSAVYREAFQFLGSLRHAFCACAARSRKIARALPCTEFREGDRPFVRKLVESLLRGAAVSRFEIACYRSVLKRIRPDAVLAIDDTRYYQEMCMAARLQKIPFYAFQHGHFTKYHAGWLASGTPVGQDVRPDALFVWSPYWKKELLRLGTNFSAEELRIGGNPKNANEASAGALYAPPKDSETIGLLVPFETDAPFDEVRSILERLLSTSRVKVWFKTRPDWDEKKQLRLYGLLDRSVDEVEAVPNHLPVLGRIHAVAGVYSTFLYDTISLMRPVFVLKTSMDFGEGMVINGLADAFDAAGEDPAGRLLSLCRDAAPKLAGRLESYRGGSGDFRRTLSLLLEKNG